MVAEWLPNLPETISTHCMSSTARPTKGHVLTGRLSREVGKLFGLITNKLKLLLLHFGQRSSPICWRWWVCGATTSSWSVSVLLDIGLRVSYSSSSSSTLKSCVFTRGLWGEFVVLKSGKRSLGQFFESQVALRYSKERTNQQTVALVDVSAALSGSGDGEAKNGAEMVHVLLLYSLSHSVSPATCPRTAPRVQDSWKTLRDDDDGGFSCARTVAPFNCQPGKNKKKENA